VRGFTLIETLITTAILVSGLVAVALLFSYTARTTLNNEKRTTATFLLYDKMEELKSSKITRGGFDDIDSFRRVWQIESTYPRKVTVLVYFGQKELIWATTMVSP
jgi:prepilin-type N-terminal cleavage/methylation domain-containing protein